MSDASTKPYLIRAIYEWCVDQGFTPHVAVLVDAQTKVPTEFIKDGQIVLNISYTATRHLKIGNDFINFSGRFNGSSRELQVPIPAVIGVFAKENGQGLFFQVTEEITASAEVYPATTTPPTDDAPPSAPKPPRGRHLKVVK